MGGLADSEMMGGLARGLKDARQVFRDDEKYQQQQNELDYQLSRREIKDQREDNKYQREEKNRLRKARAQEALRSFMVNDDVDSVNTFFDEFGPDGMKPRFTVKDGKFISLKTDQNQQPTKEVQKDSIGKLIMLMGDDNAFEQFKSGLKDKNAIKSKASENAFELKKIDRENEWKLKIARAKESIKNGGAGKIPDYSKQSAKLAGSYYGGKFENGLFSFEDGNDVKAASAQVLTDMYYLSQPESDRNINDAFRKATIIVDKASKMAKETVQKEIDAGKIDASTMKDRESQIMESLVDQYAAQMKHVRQRPALKKNAAGGQRTADDYYLFLKKKFPNRSDKQIKARVKEKFPDYSASAGKNDVKDVALARRRGYQMRKNKKQNKPTAIA